MMDVPSVSLENVSKRFGDLVALDGVDIEIRRHEVVGLIGENGAGKSTLLKILSGVYQPDGGLIRRDGKQVKLGSALAAARHGIAIVHQEQSLVPGITVAENVLLGNEGSALAAGFFNWPALRRRAKAVLDRVGIGHVDPMALTETLSFSERQMVEIAKALALVSDSTVNPIIILDEPTSVLEEKEIAVIEAEIAALTRVGSVVLISHRMDEVLRMSDRIYVMRDGKVVDTRAAAGADERDLYRLMVGRDISGGHSRQDERAQPDYSTCLLETRALTGEGFADVSLRLHAGEVLSIVGVGNSGREAFTRVLFGAAPSTSGTILVEEQEVTFAFPGRAAAHGIAYVPAERTTEGIVDGQSVRDSLTLSFPGTTSKAGLVDFHAAHRLALTWIERLSIRPPNPFADIGRLSGGNQQKVVLAKWLQSGNVKILLLDHPTRGLDVGAKDDVLRIIREQTRLGKAVVLLPDTLEEALGLSDRILVMRDGSVVGTHSVRNEAPTQVQLLAEMV